MGFAPLLASPQARAAALLGVAATAARGFAWLDGGDHGHGYAAWDPDLELESDQLADLDAVDRGWRAKPDRIWIGAVSYDLAADGVRGRWGTRRGLPGMIWRRYPGALELGPGSVIGAIGGGSAVAALAGRLEQAPRIEPGWGLGELTAVVSPGEYRAAVEAARRHIVAGDTYQVNVAQRFIAPWQEHTTSLAHRAAAAYATLRARSPADLGALLAVADGWVLSNSPETLLTLAAHGPSEWLARSLPIKGTRPRGDSSASDAAARAELRTSIKDRAEHVMIVDLVRNDLGRLARPGSVSAAAEPTELALATVHHLVTEIRAILPRSVGLRELIAALVPSGSVTGAPKRRTIEIIDALEGAPRGIYCGAIILLGPHGVTMSVPIRTACVCAAGLPRPDGGAVALAATALSSELERRLISSPDSPLDLIEFNPGFLQNNSAFATGGSVTALSLGRQLSNRLFVILNLGGCFNQGAAAFSQQYLGASLEYRLHPTLKLQVAAEPVQSCLSEVASTLVRPSRYQFGADLKWDREY